jgi:hypothetical protein
MIEEEALANSGVDSVHTDKEIAGRTLAVKEL